MVEPVPRPDITFKRTKPLGPIDYVYDQLEGPFGLEQAKLLIPEPSLVRVQSRSRGRYTHMGAFIFNPERQILHARRCRISERATLTPGTVVHNNAWIGASRLEAAEVGPNAFVDDNTILRTRVHIGYRATVGSGVIIGEYGDVEKDTTIENNCTLEYEVTVRAGSHIRDHSHIGHNSDVLIHGDQVHLAPHSVVK